MAAQGQRRSHAFLFKVAIVVATVASAGFVLYLLPIGRYGLARLNSAFVNSTSALRDPTDPATLGRIRSAAIQAAKASVELQWSNAGDAEREFLRETGLAPDQAVCRWGNGNNACVLSGNVFELDERRSYRLHPGTSSVWVRFTPKSGPAESFLVPDEPAVRAHAEALGYQVLIGTEQTTNSWGCRGPEPDSAAELRILVVGDSFMQGMFVADDETPPRQLEERLRALSGKTVSVLNTGHLGYSPEQYYYTALEYLPQLRPNVLIISTCANDTSVEPGSGRDLLAAKDWLTKIDKAAMYKAIPPAACLMVLAPLHQNLEKTRNAHRYPACFMDMISFRGAKTLDPTDAFINEDLRLRGPRGLGPQALFNIHLADGHFSPRGSAIWAEETARRVLLLLGIGR